MIKKYILLLLFGLLVGSSAWAQGYLVLDTGDASERICNPKSYTDLGNGIVRDEITGLEWDRWGASGSYSWQGALNYCSSLKLGGNQDWRLPTLEELATLVDAGRYDPAIGPVFFSATGEYWTSTAFERNTANAYFIDFASGSLNNTVKRTTFNVRAVRGGIGGPQARFILQLASELGVSVSLAGQPCSNDLDCDSGEECIDDICIPSNGQPCSNDLDCDSGKECIDDICVPSTGQPCSNDLDCDSVEECIDDICVPSDGDPCSSDLDCESGEECIAGMCVPSSDESCLSDLDCDSGEECIADWCVPVNTQPGRFTVNGDGTVTDNSTDLIWTECAYGQTWDGLGCSDVAQTLDFDAAIAFVQNMNNINYLGYGDWRLPTINELQSLMDRSRFLPTTTFPGMGTGLYWASTNNEQDNEKAWDACFWFGNIHSDAVKSERGIYTMRAVRGGACMSDGVWCMDDEDCTDGYVCTDGACVEDQCELNVKHTVIRSEKLTKPRKVVLKISSDEDFDVFGSLDLGPFTWVKSVSNTKKGRLKVKVVVPRGLEPGIISISVGDCSGLVEIQ